MTGLSMTYSFGDAPDRPNYFTRQRVEATLGEATVTIELVSADPSNGLMTLNFAHGLLARELAKEAVLWDEAMK